MACYTALRRLTIPSCPLCGRQVTTGRNRYCSRACQGNAKRVPEPKWTHPNRIADRRAHHTAWRRKNAEYVLQKAREWVDLNREKRREIARKWVRDNPDKVQAMKVRRRAVVSEALPPGTWDAIKARYGNRCLACGRTDRPLTVDHVIPLVRGGTHTAANIQPLCKPCNSQKNTKSTDYRVGFVVDREIAGQGVEGIAVTRASSRPTGSAVPSRRSPR